MVRDRPPEDGTVRLQSGAWNWHARRAAAGTTVVYQHTEHDRDEMRAWTPARVLTADEVVALAREPVLRLWTDSLGHQWSVTVERARRNRPGWGDRFEAPTDTRHLVFQRHGARRLVPLEPETTLGELTRAELQRRFDSA